MNEMENEVEESGSGVWVNALASGEGRTVTLASGWTKERPNFACVFVGRSLGSGRHDFSLWEFGWTLGDPPEDADLSEHPDTTYYYLAWTDTDGNEYDDIEECNFDEYLVLAQLPTLAEIEI